MAQAEKVGSEKQKPNWELFFLVLFMEIAVAFIFLELFDGWFESLTSLLGIELIAILFQHIILIGGLGFLIYLFIINNNILNGKKTKKLFTIGIILSFAFLYVGIILIDQVISGPDLDSVLRDKNTNEILGKIDCPKGVSAYQEESVITCVVQEPFLLNSSSNITLRDRFDIINIFKGNNTISFEAHPRTTYLYFEVSGYLEDGSFVTYHVRRPFNFKTEEELLNLNDKKLTYLIGLLALISLTTPLILLNWKKIYDEK